MSLFQFRQFLRRNAAWIVLVSLVAAVGCFLYAGSDPTYTATASVQASAEDAAVAALSGAYQSPLPMSEIVDSLASTATSPAVLRAALKLADAHLITKPPAASVSATTSPDSSSPIVTITSTSPSPTRAAVIANSVAQALVSQETLNQRQTYLTAAAAISDQIPILLRELSTDRAQLRSDPSDVTLRANLGAVTSRYDNAYGQRQSLLAQASAVSPGVSLTAEASPPTSPRHPPMEYGLLGLFLGLLLGLGLCLLREQLDDRLRTVDDLDFGLRERLIGQVPALRESRIGPGIHDPQVLDELRAAWLHAQMVLEHPISSVVVTSADDGEGKSFVAAQLAVAIAGMDRKVVLASADLRRPSLEQHFELDGDGHGLADLLVKTNARASEKVGALRETQVPGLRVLAPGSRALSSTLLLNKTSVARITSWLQQSADVVIFDTAPLMPVPDTLGLIGQVDLVIVVVSIGRTSERRVNAALRKAHAGRQSTVILANRVPSASHYYGAYQQIEA